MELTYSSLAAVPLLRVIFNLFPTSSKRGVVVPVKVPSMGQKEMLNYLLKIIIIIICSLKLFELDRYT